MKRQCVGGAAAALVAIGLLAAASPVHALLPDGLAAISSAPWGAWKSEIVEATWVHDIYQTSVALDAAGRPHIVYTGGASVTDGTGSAWYAWHDGIGWNRMLLQEGAFGQGVAVEEDGTVHVLFNSFTPDNKIELRHGTITPVGIEIEVLTLRNSNIPAAEIAADATGTLHVYYSFPGSTFYDMVYGRNTGSGWTFETVDVSTAAFDDSSGMAVNEDGEVHIAFEDYGNAWGVEKVGYAVRDAGGTWAVQRVTPGCYDAVDIALDDDGRPHISCRSRSEGLTYLHFDGTAWSRDVLDDGITFRGPELRAFDTAIAVDSHGRPHVSYRDAVPLTRLEEVVAPAHMKYAMKIGDEWMYETVDRTASATGITPDIVIDAQDRPRLSYVMGWVVGGAAVVGQDLHRWNLMYAEPASTPLGLVDE